MNEQKKIGIIGYGFLGKSLHESLVGTSIEVARIYNRSPEKMTGAPESRDFYLVAL